MYKKFADSIINDIDDISFNVNEGVISGEINLFNNENITDKFHEIDVSMISITAPTVPTGFVFNDPIYLDISQEHYLNPYTFLSDVSNKDNISITDLNDQFNNVYLEVQDDIVNKHKTYINEKKHFIETNGEFIGASGDFVEFSSLSPHLKHRLSILVHKDIEQSSSEFLNISGVVLNTASETASLVDALWVPYMNNINTLLTKNKKIFTTVSTNNSYEIVVNQTWNELDLETNHNIAVDEGENLTSEKILIKNTKVTWDNRFLFFLNESNIIKLRLKTSYAPGNET